MKIVILLLLCIQTYIVANIDINKKAITVTLSSTLSQSMQIASDLDKYDVYIYKPSTTKTLYYVIYAVNIEKKDQKKSLNNIKQLFNDSYLSSDSRVNKLATNNFKKNIFIKASTKYQEKTIENIKEKTKIVSIDKEPKTIKKLEVVKKFEIIKEINIDENAKELSKSQEYKYIKKDKKILFIGYANKKKISYFIKRYNFHDIVIEQTQENKINDNNFAVYIVNIDNENFDFLLEYMTKYYPFTKEILHSKFKNTNHIKYIAKKKRKPIYQINGCS